MATLEGGRGRWGATFAHPLESAHLGAIFHFMDAEVNLGQRFLLADGANSIVDLHIARIRRAGATVGVHSRWRDAGDGRAELELRREQGYQSR